MLSNLRVLVGLEVMLLALLSFNLNFSFNSIPKAPYTAVHPLDIERLKNK
jgi:hypothetical protein